MFDDPDRSLQDPVRVIAIFLGCLTILVGVSSIVHDGDLELSIVGIAINIFISGVLFLGAKRRSTTHLMVWLMFTLLQIIGLVVGMCYFSYEAQSLSTLYNSLPSEPLPLPGEKLENIHELRIAYIVYAIVCGILIALFLFISVIVKKFHDEIKRQDPFGTSGYQETTDQLSPDCENEVLPGSNVQATVIFTTNRNPSNHLISEDQPSSGYPDSSKDSSMKSISINLP